MATKQEMEKKQELARILYMNDTPQKEIAEKIGVSAVTLSNWVAKFSWKETKAARNITRPELVNKLLLAINNLLDQVNQSHDINLITGVGDKLSKLAAVVEKLDKKANVVDAIEVFMAFGKWLQFRSASDPELTPELLKAINRYQDLYIGETISAGR